MDDDTVFEGRTPPRRFMRTDLIVVSLNLLSEMFEAASDAFASLTMLTAAHANYKVDQEQFRQDATIEIETITGDVDE